MGFCQRALKPKHVLYVTSATSGRELAMLLLPYRWCALLLGRMSSACSS